MANLEQIQTLIDRIRDEVAYLESTVNSELAILEQGLESTDPDAVEEAMNETINGCMTAFGGQLSMLADYSETLGKTVTHYHASLVDQQLAERALKHRLNVGG